MGGYQPRRQPVSSGRRQEPAKDASFRGSQWPVCVAERRYPDSLLGHRQVADDADGAAAVFLPGGLERGEAVHLVEGSGSAPGEAGAARNPGTRDGPEGQCGGASGFVRIHDGGAMVPPERISVDCVNWERGDYFTRLRGGSELSPAWDADCGAGGGAADRGIGEPAQRGISGQYEP